jgi:hypothetical protein
MTEEIKSKIEEIKSKTNVKIFLDKIQNIEESTDMSDEDSLDALSKLQVEIDEFKSNYEKINSEINELDKIGFGYKDTLIDRFNELINDNYKDIYSVMGGREYINKTIVQNLLLGESKDFDNLYDFSMKWDVTPLYPDDNTFKVTYRVGKPEGISRGFTWFYNFSGVLYERKFDFLK